MNNEKLYTESDKGMKLYNEDGELLGSNSVDVRELLKINDYIEPIDEKEALNILNHSGAFKDINITELSDYQLNHIVKFIQANQLVREGKSIQDALDVVKFRRSYFYDVVNYSPIFRNYHVRTMEDKSHYLAEQTLVIANDKSNDFYVGKDGIMLPNNVAVQRNKLQIEAIQFYIRSINKKVYGNSTTIGGDEDNPLKVVAVTGMVIK